MLQSMLHTSAHAHCVGQCLGCMKEERRGVSATSIAERASANSKFELPAVHACKGEVAERRSTCSRACSTYLAMLTVWGNAWDA